MKKKVVFFIMAIVVVSVGWFVYRAFHSSLEKISTTDTDTKLVSIETITPPSLKINTSVSDKTSFENKSYKKNYREKEVQDERFELFDKLEKAWLEKAQEIIGTDRFALYLDMRNQCDKEKMQAYKEFHNYLRQKYGDKFSYNISDDQSLREKEINQRYLKELAKLIGPLKFRNYITIKDQFNELMRKEYKESIQIEF